MLHWSNQQANEKRNQSLSQDCFPSAIDCSEMTSRSVLVGFASNKSLRRAVFSAMADRSCQAESLEMASYSWADHFATTDPHELKCLTPQAIR